MSKTGENHHKLYNTLIIDPPWPVLPKNNKHYKLMSIEQIKAMPIESLLNPSGAHVWLWCTSSTMQVAHETLEGWNCIPRSIYTWIKPRMGTGSWLRHCTEFCILGVYKNAPVKFRGQIDYGWFTYTGHSEKPTEFYKIVERVSPGPNYLELFARRKTLGWDAWGDQIESALVLPGYPVPKYSEKIIKNIKKESDAS